MAPRTRRGPATGLRAVTTTLAAAILVSLFLSLCPLSDAATASPTPQPSAAPAPHLSPPPPRQQATSATSPRATPPPPQLRHGRAHSPRAAPRPDRSWWSWHQRLNLGQRVGIVLAIVAVAMQVALAAYLAVRARQLRRAAKAHAEEPPTPARPVRAPAA